MMRWISRAQPVLWLTAGAGRNLSQFRPVRDDSIIHLGNICGNSGRVDRALQIGTRHKNPPPLAEALQRRSPPKAR